jgi:integrase
MRHPFPADILANSVWQMGRVMTVKVIAHTGSRAYAWVETGLVFTTKHGTPIDPRNFNRSFDRCIVAARVPRITVHGTRKTCATLLAALDVHPRVAMRILRHSKINVTMEIYTEAPSEATGEALRKLSEELAA